jgi:hypothetical protein
VLAPEDEFLHLAVHAAGHGLERLLWLHDLDLFLEKHSLDGSVVRERARELGLAPALDFALQALERRLGVAVPWSRRGIRPRLADRLLAARRVREGSLAGKLLELAFRATLTERLASVPEALLARFERRAERPIESAPERVSSFAERFAVAPVGDAALALDLETGSVYRLNGTASRVALALARGESEALAASELVREGASDEQAARDVASVIATLAQNGPSLVEGDHELRFVEGAAGFRMLLGGEPLLRIDRAGTRVALLGDARDAALVLRWAVPHILALQGRPLLHASAVETESGVVAFSGPSGAGKTTTAELLARRGARLVSRDLLALVLEHEPLVLIEGEARLDRWIASRAERFREAREIDASDLGETLAGLEARPLARFVFLDAARREGDAIRIEPLALEAALLEHLRNGFSELGAARAWRDLLELSRALASSVETEAWTVPLGLDRFEAALPAASREERTAT